LHYLKNALLLIIIYLNIKLSIIYTNSMRKTLKGFLIILTFAFFTACLAPDTIRLDEKEKRAMVQKIFTEKATTLESKLDQGCEQNYYRMISKATDSLVNVYLDSLNQNNR
jgi:hypothetical protein